MATSAKTIVKREVLKLKNGVKIWEKVDSVKTSKYAGGSSMYINTTDLTAKESKELEAIANMFQYGDFDGMTDSYNYRGDRVETDISFKYVFVNNHISEKKRDNLMKKLAKEYGVTNDEESFARFGRELNHIVNKLNDGKL